MLSTVRTATDAAARIAAPGPLRQANRDLAVALRNDDLSGAQQAYATLAKAVPEGVELKPGSPFATLGEALGNGDLQAAQGAYADIFRSRVERTPRQPEPAPAPAPSTTGGSAGTLLNAVA